MALSHRCSDPRGGVGVFKSPGPCGPPWALVFRHLMGSPRRLWAPLLPLRARPLWAPMGPHGLGPCGPPWAFVRPPGPLWARPL